MASNCLVDKLGPGRYTTTWRNYRVPASQLPADAIEVAPPNHWLPKQKSAAAQQRARAIEHLFTDEPATSHTVDCAFLIPQRYCNRCTVGQNKLAHYVAYLPKALFVDPTRVRSILTLVPGGRGGRHRPFLTPLPGKTVFQRGSGGLRVKQHVDHWLAAHPNATPPIVVAVQSHGDAYPNGSIEYLSFDLPKHLSDTFLAKRPLDDLVLGAEGISSGAMAIVRVMHAKPGRFATVGLTCMSCFLVDPGRGPARQQFQHQRWAARLARQRRAGLFAMRFNIGSRDGQLPCNRRFYETLAAGGLFDDQPIRYHGCTDSRPPDADHCDTQQDGFVQWHNEMHHYSMLAKSYPAQLDWHLEQLDSIDKRRNHARATPL